MEDEMLKVAAVCAALIAFATGPLGAYEREANIQRNSWVGRHFRYDRCNPKIRKRADL